MSAGKVDVLAVMARLVSSVNDDDIELDARADLHRDGTEARDAVADLIAVAERAKLFVMNVPTDSQLDAKLASGDTGREVWGALVAALARVQP